ncbi:MAG: enoyl-CoA hydratase-related protein [Ornithinimicrobium sp.]
MTSTSMLTATRHGDHDHIVVLALDRPEAMNAISTEFARQITATMAELAADPRVSVVVLTSSAPRAFCVGADLKERAGFSTEELMAHREVSRAAYRSVLDLPMPVVAALEGYALGGGLELALSCDLIIASASAELALPEVSVGLIPGGGGTQLLTRRLGWSKAASMIFTAARLSADSAHHLGLVDQLVHEGSALSEALVLARSIAANSPVALREAKSAMRNGQSANINEALDIEDKSWRATAISADREEGISAFNEKRAPHWDSLQSTTIKS